MVLHRITLLVIFLVLIPFVQYAFGVISLAGTAWVSVLYLLGFLLAILIGAYWESGSPGQFADGLFLAVGIAGLFSVGLQLQQWLVLGGLELWNMGGGQGRPHANLGQPNQLGTLLLWSLLGAAWGRVRKHIGAWTFLLMALYLLFGLALTGSRTAWVGVALLVTATWLWRRLWNSPRWPWVISGLGLYFVFCVTSVGWLSSAWLGSLAPRVDMLSQTSAMDRLATWAAFIDAAWKSPFLGYGWNQGALAQTAVAAEHPHLHGAFSYSHNLFLDLVLWCGIPLGLLISVSLLFWFWMRLRAVRCAENAMLMLFLLVVANHAMFELPLYFAYFLLPVGMVVGGLNTRLGAQTIALVGRWTSFFLWLVTTTLLVIVIRDYLHVEKSYQTLRLEWQGFKRTIPTEPPDVLLLTQWRHYVDYARFEPKAGLGEEDLDWMRSITGLFPNIIFSHKLATILALNQRPEEASLWLKRMCNMAPEEQCQAVEKKWAKQSLEKTEIAGVPWPIKVPDHKITEN